MPLFATAIDPTEHAFFRDVNAAGVAGIQHGSDVYVFCITVGQKFNAYKSSDAGATWVIQDQANNPGVSGCNIWFDGLHTVYVVACDLNVLAPMDIYTFDLATDTWNIFAVSGPKAFSTNAIWGRSDGSFIIIYDANTVPGKGSASRLWTVVYDAGGNWIADQDTGVAGRAIDPAMNIFVYPSPSCLDASDRLHIIYGSGDYSLWMYQAVESDNSLGAANTFSATLSSIFHVYPAGQLTVVAGSLLAWIVCANSTAVKIYVGNSLTAPTWTLSDAISATNPTVTPCLQYDSDSATLVALITGTPGTTPNGLTYKAVTTNTANPGIGWTESLFYNFDALQPPNDDPLVGVGNVNFALAPLNGYVAGSYSNTSVHAMIGFFIGSFTLTPIPVPTVPDVMPINAQGLSVVVVCNPSNICGKIRSLKKNGCRMVRPI